MAESTISYPDDLLHPKLAPYAVAVGALSNSWALLESATRMLFICVSGMPADRAAFGIVHCLDFRDLLTAIKIAFVEKRGGDDAITNFAIDTTNYIDNGLRPRRNRFVHDIWRYDDYMEAVERFEHTPRIIRQQARAPRTWTATHISVDELAAVWDTTQEITEHAALLYQLQGGFLDHEEARKALLGEPPRRRFQRPQSVNATS